MRARTYCAHPSIRNHWQAPEQTSRSGGQSEARLLVLMSPSNLATSFIDPLQMAVANLTIRSSKTTRWGRRVKIQIVGSQLQLWSRHLTETKNYELHRQ
ncbi:hypothetical protein TNCV_4331421 [Trichonephila clavipes]|nr:hypothetical protein TNCV_4331421 [Trichonephila clavipes]